MLGATAYRPVHARRGGIAACRGPMQKTIGKAQAKFGDVKQDVKDATKS